MIREKRFQHILARLEETEVVYYTDLSADLNVSEDTIRRDIEYLHQNGLLLKVRGGAISRDKNPLSFHDRTSYHSSEKEIIALKVQPLIKSGMTIFMDGGTTMCAVAERFPANSSFRVVTNNLALIPVLSNFTDIEVIVLGGNYNKDTQTSLGAKTCGEAGDFVADLYLMGICAISSEYGITAAVREDGAVKKAMIRSSRKVVALSNSKKIGHTEPFVVCDLSNINVIITELPSTDSTLDSLRFQNIAIL